MQELVRLYLIYGTVAELDANLRLSCVNSVSKIESNKGYVVRVLPFMVAGTQDKNNNAGNKNPARAKPFREDVMKTQNEWIINGETGISSKTMWAAINGVTLKGVEYPKNINFDVPYDPSDFNRCLKYVEDTGITKEQLQTVKEVFPWWAPFIDNWEKIVEIFKSELHLRSMHKTFDYIQELEKEARLLAGWKETAPGCWEYKVSEVKNGN